MLCGRTGGHFGVTNVDKSPRGQQRVLSLNLHGGPACPAWLFSPPSCVFVASQLKRSLLLPFSVFPLYACTHLVKGHFLMLRPQSGTLSLTKSGHPTPSHPSNRHLKLVFFSSPTDCVCVVGEMGRGGERGGGKGERERERGRTSGLSQSVSFFFPHLFYFM